MQMKSTALIGYANPNSRSPFLWSSNADGAYRIGQWLHNTHRTAPRDVRPSRGDTFHVNDMKVRIVWKANATFVERIS